MLAFVWNFLSLAFRRAERAVENILSENNWLVWEVCVPVLRKQKKVLVRKFWFQMCPKDSSYLTQGLSMVMELCPGDLKSEMEIFSSWQWFFWCHAWVFFHIERVIYSLYEGSHFTNEEHQEKQQMTECCSPGRAEDQGVKGGKS